MIPLDRRVIAAKDVLIRQVGGESVLLNLQNEQYLGLDAVGTQMWLALMSCDSIEAAQAALLREYDVDAGQLQVDLQELLGKFLEHGLVEVSGEPLG